MASLYLINPVGKPSEIMNYCYKINSSAGRKLKVLNVLAALNQDAVFNIF